MNGNLRCSRCRAVVAAGREHFRIISQSHLSPDCVYTVLEEYFIGSWFHFSVQALQSNSTRLSRASNRSYISHSIKPMSTSAIEKCIIRLLTDATNQHKSCSTVLCQSTDMCNAASRTSYSQPLPVTFFPKSSRLTVDNEESHMLSTWDPSQPKTQLELEPCFIGKDTSETKAFLKTDIQCARCDDAERARMNWKLSPSGHDSVGLDDTLAHLLSGTLDTFAVGQIMSGTLDISTESEIMTIIKSKQHDVHTLCVDKSLTMPSSSKELGFHELDARGCHLSDVVDSHHCWLVEFDDPVFCQRFFSTFQESSETKLPEEWRQDQQVESPISKIALNRQDRILTGCTAASNGLSSGCSMQNSGTSGFGLWSVNQHLASCSDLKTSYQCETFPVDGESIPSPRFVSTPLHVAKKRCVQVTPLETKTGFNRYDCGSPLLFSESDNEKSRTEVESSVNCGVTVNLGYTPELFSQ
ncbi:uncharacterized protein LOC134189819 isoform X2 [Corticium candelabrum]|uniref:uncharacterized protein LOC134189819 isoform X2 n=1 Tax=Corticium candelabrum TaxID=121492 RepID=UPI002E257CD0|nr:uncharacterized protein LOC134189819 isoform X2 [Corticium candelabrum]